MESCTGVITACRAGTGEREQRVQPAVSAVPGLLLDLCVLYQAQLLRVHCKPLPICLLAHPSYNNVHPPRKAGTVGLGFAQGQ